MTTELPLNNERLLARFLRYVQIDTTAAPGSKTYPSSACQLELGKLLAQELKAMGLKDAVQSKQGIVTATVPATSKKKTPTIAFVAHVDTSPETTGKNVKPQVWRNYDGSDIA